MHIQRTSSEIFKEVEEERIMAVIFILEPSRTRLFACLTSLLSHLLHVVPII